MLATVDESTYDEVDDSAAADDHPIAWCSNFDGGRAWYTGIGHTQATFSEPDALKHLLGGLKTAAKAVDADCGAERQRTPTTDDFEVATLAKGADKIGEPIALGVLPDRRVLHTARDGRVFLTTPNATTSLAAHDQRLLARRGRPAGRRDRPELRARTSWVYLFYAPRLTTPLTDAPTDGTGRRVRAVQGPQPALALQARRRTTSSTSRPSRRSSRSRPTAACAATSAATWTSTPRATCTSSTGDDSNPFSSDGYAPIDDRANRNPAFDARRTSGNTNDLRGKVLRIKVAADGTYTVPAGNMFAPGRWARKPEIYAMGFRNPFRFAVDKKTGWVYLGDYGPDAGGANPNRGPGGQVEFNLIKEPGNYGWPYCIGKQRRVQRLRLRHRHDRREVQLRGAEERRRASTRAWSTSRRPPGLDRLRRRQRPGVRLAAASRRWAARPTTSTPTNPSTTKFPAYFDGKNFAYEFGRALDPDVHGRHRRRVARRSSRFMDSFDFKQLIDMRVRPRRLAVRARLRHGRLLPGRRELGGLPRRLRPGHAHRRSSRPRPTRRPARRR